MADTDELTAARAELVAAADEMKKLEAQREEASQRVADAIVRARRAGMTPTEAEQLSPFTAAWTRKVARNAGIAPARRGAGR